MFSTTAWISSLWIICTIKYISERKSSTEIPELCYIFRNQNLQPVFQIYPRKGYCRTFINYGSQKIFCISRDFRRASSVFFYGLYPVQFPENRLLFHPISLDKVLSLTHNTSPGFCKIRYSEWNLHLLCDAPVKLLFYSLQVVWMYNFTILNLLREEIINRISKTVSHYLRQKSQASTSSFFQRKITAGLLLTAVVQHFLYFKSFSSSFFTFLPLGNIKHHSLEVCCLREWRKFYWFKPIHGRNRYRTGLRPSVWSLWRVIIERSKKYDLSSLRYEHGHRCFTVT